VPAAYLVDGILSGTGIRDAVNGGYVEPEQLGLSAPLSREIADWQQRYEDAHFDGFPDNDVAQLDIQGAALASRAAAERTDVEFGYYSNGLLKRLI